MNVLPEKVCPTNDERIVERVEKLLKSKEAAMQVMNIHAKSGYSLSLDQTINQNLADQIWSA